MTDLKDLLKEKRPNLSQSSLITYTSTLNSLHKKLFGSVIDPKNFNNTDVILHFLKDIPPNKRKSILASLVVVCENPEYRNLMLEDIKVYNKETAKQRKTINQEASWIDQPDINIKYKEMEGIFKVLLKKNRDNITSKEFQTMQDFVMLSLLGGIYIPPRRLKDFIDFRIRPIVTEDPNKVNTRTRNKLIFNSYKTSKTYGQQTVQIPPKLRFILDKWNDYNPTFYLFIDTKGRPLTNVKMNQRLNKIFSKKVSVNQLRHSYLSHKYQDRIENNAELAKDFEDMGSSMHQEKVYIKTD